MTPIANCKVEFAFQCPKQWDELAPAENATVRYCHICKEKVHYVTTMAQVHDHSSRGECIAIGWKPHTRKFSERMLIGRPVLKNSMEFKFTMRKEKKPWWKIFS